MTCRTICDVDPIFGTLADFDALVARAHALGLKVVIDQVYAHTSDQHAWFVESRASRSNPRADWYVWADPKADGTPPNNWQSVFGGPAWTWDARRGQYYLHNFLSAQPHLNVHNPAVQQQLLDTARFWLDRGVDGFRLDAINFAMHDPALTDNPPAPDDGSARTRPFDFQLHRYNQSHADIPLFLERIRALLDSYGDRFTVAEIGGAEADAEMKLFTAGERRLNTRLRLRFSLRAEADAGAGAGVARTLAGGAGFGWPSWAFSNHDAPRAISRWADPAHAATYARMAMLLLVALRGNIFLYQGDELGLTQVEIGYDDLRDPEAIANWPLTLSRDGARTPMPWMADAAPCRLLDRKALAADRPGPPRARGRPAGGRAAVDAGADAATAGAAPRMRRAAARRDGGDRGRQGAARLRAPAWRPAHPWRVQHGRWGARLAARRTA